MNVEPKSLDFDRRGCRFWSPSLIGRRGFQLPVVVL